MKKKINVFLTGASGHMGYEAAKLLSINPEINLKLLSLGSRKDKMILKPFQRNSNVQIIKGDLRNFEDVKKGVRGSNIVLHVGALIPPVADHYPKITNDINYYGTINIINAIKEEKNKEHIMLVYISTVASMGYRPAPIHWARVGDPIKVCKFDVYAASKVKAERAVVESGLNRWVSLRQSGMLHKDILKLMDPIIFHQPLNNHIEWSTAEDSGQALYNICTMNLPPTFFRNIYNIGSGPQFRETYYEFLQVVFKKLGVQNIQKIFKPNNFATNNFHCVWYRDSEKLNNIIHYRKNSYEEFWQSVNVPFYYKVIKFIPPSLFRKLIIEPLAKKNDGPINWLKNCISEKINAYWGSLEDWKKLPQKWKDFKPGNNYTERFISHGFNEQKSFDKINIKDCIEAARFRGGSCLSKEMDIGDNYKELKWRCSCGNEFYATPNLVLFSGHWCPICDLDVDNYKTRAENSKFFTQVYTPVNIYN